MTPSLRQRLRESLAAIEHEQWMQWAKAIMALEPISPDRRIRWEHLMVPYDQLSKAEKESDRRYADIVLSLLQPEVEALEAKHEDDRLIFLNPRDAADLHNFADASVFTEEEVLQALVEIAFMDLAGDLHFKTRLLNHAAALKIGKPYAEPVPEPKSRW